jgi:uncharacterized membrane protein YkvA (DUF1232 family)
LSRSAFEKLKSLLAMLKDIVMGKYTNYSSWSLIVIVIAVLYFVSPIDFIPDFIFALGLVDDGVVIVWAYSTILKEIERYDQWRESEGDKVD